jgi:hypothetical protein
LLQLFGAVSFTPAVLILAVVGTWIAFAARSNGFPTGSRSTQ